MNRYILISLITLALFSCDIRRNDKTADVKGKDAANTAEPTTMVQLIDSVYNFGKVKEGEMVTYNYRFKNIGTNPLVIYRTSASCGCTVPQKPEKPVMPGETSEIKVAFNSKGKLGHNDKTIMVVANTKPAFPVLKLSGEVVEVK